MRTVGQILREEREKKFYSLDEIEKVTKIRKELLEALEGDNYAKLPPPTFVQGFIKNYGKFLSLDTEKLLAIHRREFSDRKNPPRILETFANPLKKSRFTLTPAKFLSTFIVILILIFFSYLWFEFRYLAGPPILEILKPQDQITVTDPSLEIAGRTNPETAVTINNQTVEVDGQGNFVQEIKLSGGATKITISATSKFGKTITVERTVYLR